MSRPRRLQILYPPAHFTDALELLDVTPEAKLFGEEFGPGNAGVAEEQIGRFGDRVLEQPVDENYVPADEFATPGDSLDRDLAVMGDQLEVETRDQDAGVAFAGRRLSNR